MVGAMADWFAVTALFRHPLGPARAAHRARAEPQGRVRPQPRGVLRRELPAGAGDPRTTGLRRHRAARRGLAGGAGPRRAGGAARRASAAAIGLRRLRDEDVASLVEEVLIPRFIAEPISPVAGGLLQEIVADDAHHGLVDLGARGGLPLAGATTRRPSPTSSASGRPGGRRTGSTTRSPTGCTSRWSAGSPTSAPTRPPRAQGLRQPAAPSSPQDLLHDPATQERAENLKRRVLEQPQTLATGMSLWSAFRRALLEALDDVDGPLRERATRELAAFGARIGTRRGAAAAARHLGCPTSWCGPWTATARSWPRSSPPPSSAGTARRPPGASSCTSAATCSSSGSTAPSSAAWSGVVIHAVSLAL